MKNIRAVTSLIQPSVKTPEHWMAFSCFDLTANHSYVLTAFHYNLNPNDDAADQFLDKLNQNAATQFHEKLNPNHESDDAQFYHKVNLNTGAEESHYKINLNDDVDAAHFHHKCPDAAEKFDVLVSKLKHSLSQVLVPFYPMAGRVCNNQDDSVSELVCNDEGAIFTAAHVDATIAEVDQDSDFSAISGMFSARLGPGILCAPGPSGLPALVVQLSLFTCGGVVLIVNWHHQVADGYSAFHFMKSWAEIARGDEISLAPVHQRSLLGPRVPPQVTIPMENYYDIGEQQLSSNPGQDAVSQVFGFSREAIADLVREASGRRERRFTRAESLAGHIWRSLAKVRDMNPAERIHFVSVVDARKRFSRPPVPPGYFGNAICIAKTSSTVQRLLQEPLEYAADLVHEAYVSVTDDYLHSLIDFIKLRGTKNVFKGRDRVLGRDVRVAFWTHFPVFDLDFGWGFPNKAGLSGGANARSEGTAVVMPGRPGSGELVVRLCLEAHCMKKLNMDPTFIPS